MISLFFLYCSRLCLPISSVVFSTIDIPNNSFQRSITLSAAISLRSSFLLTTPLYLVNCFLNPTTAIIALRKTTFVSPSLSAIKISRSLKKPILSTSFFPSRYCFVSLALPSKDSYLISRILSDSFRRL